MLFACISAVIIAQVALASVGWTVAMGCGSRPAQATHKTADAAITIARMAALPRPPVAAVVKLHGQALCASSQAPIRTRRALRLGRARRFVVDVDVIDKWQSKKWRPLFKKHPSNKSLSLVILRTIDERNRTRPPTVPAVHRTGRSAKLPGGLCVSIERPHLAGPGRL
jgi:hypothetical protein